MRTVVGVMVAIALAGCASNSGIVPMGKDTFLLAKQQATGFPGLGNLKPEILQEANAFCGSKGTQLQVVNVSETQPPYVLGNYPRVEVQFMCLAADDPNFRRPKLEKAPDSVIEIRKP